MYFKKLVYHNENKYVHQQIKPSMLVKMNQKGFLSAEPSINDIVKRKKDSKAEIANWLNFLQIYYKTNKPL